MRVNLQRVEDARQQRLRLGGAALVVQGRGQQVNQLVHMYRGPVAAQAHVLETVAACGFMVEKKGTQMMKKIKQVKVPCRYYRLSTEYSASPN